MDACLNYTRLHSPHHKHSDLCDTSRKLPWSTPPRSAVAVDLEDYVDKVYSAQKEIEASLSNYQAANCAFRRRMNPEQAVNSTEKSRVFASLCAKTRNTRASRSIDLESIISQSVLAQDGDQDWLSAPYTAQQVARDMLRKIKPYLPLPPIGAQGQQNTLLSDRASPRRRVNKLRTNTQDSIINSDSHHHSDEASTDRGKMVCSVQRSPIQNHYTMGSTSERLTPFRQGNLPKHLHSGQGPPFQSYSKCTAAH